MPDSAFFLLVLGNLSSHSDLLPGMGKRVDARTFLCLLSHKRTQGACLYSSQRSVKMMALPFEWREALWFHSFTSLYLRVFVSPVIILISSLTNSLLLRAAPPLPLHRAQTDVFFLPVSMVLHLHSEHLLHSHVAIISDLTLNSQ